MSGFGFVELQIDDLRFQKERRSCMGCFQIPDLTRWRIDIRRIFCIWDSTGDVPPVAMSQVADGDLLNESFGAAGDASVLHANE